MFLLIVLSSLVIPKINSVVHYVIIFMHSFSRKQTHFLVQQGIGDLYFDIFIYIVCIAGQCYISNEHQEYSIFTPVNRDAANVHQQYTLCILSVIFAFFTKFWSGTCITAIKIT